MKSSFEPSRPANAGGFIPLGSPQERPVVALAQPSLEEAVREAYERGRRDERDERPAVDPAALQAAARSLAAAADSLAQAGREALAASSQAVLDLALTVAERIVRTQLRADWEGLRERLETALASLDDGEPPVIELAEGDLELCRNHQAGALDALFARGDLRFEAAASLQPGEARVRSGGAVIDARIEAMLEPFRTELAALLVQTGGPA